MNSALPNDSGYDVISSRDKIISCLNSVNKNNKAAIVRVDFNVQVSNGKIVDLTRIIAAKETIDLLSKENVRIILVSHFKDPKQEDLISEETKKKFSFTDITGEISDCLCKKIILLDLFDSNLKEKINQEPLDSIILLDNSRFWNGEKKNDPILAEKIASLGDVFVNEAFSCAHRMHASNYGVSKFLPKVNGIHFDSEIAALKKAFESPAKPVLAVIGGAKVSSKFPILENLLPKVDFLAIGGAMAHTFFVYQGLSVGMSLFEPEYVEKAGELLEKYREKILFPCDLIVAKDLYSETFTVDILNRDGGIKDGFSAYDIGTGTVVSWAPIIKNAKTIIWNGTLGVAENEPFDEGSKKIAALICENKNAFSLAGGGDTLSALNSLGFADKFSHVCTGGGAFLEWLANGKLPVE